MRPILPGIDSIEQHNIHVFNHPDDYRPDCCPYCRKEKLWHFGHYDRQPDREHGGHNSLNPVRILRFRLSLLQTNLFNASRMHCTKTMVSMAYSTGCSGVAFA